MSSSVMELKRRFGIRAAGCELTGLGIFTAGDFSGFTDEEILRLPNVGPKTLARIRAIAPYMPERHMQPEKITDLWGKLPSRGISRLLGSGIETVQKLRETPDRQLLGIRDIGPETIKRIRAVVPFAPSQSPVATTLPKERQEGADALRFDWTKFFE